jgi:peptide/nickel transport system substrate-binding protein
MVSQVTFERLPRRHALRLLTLGGAAALLAACRPVSPATPAAQPTAPPAAALTPGSGVGAAAPVAVQATAVPGSQAATPRSGGTLRMAFAGDLSTIDGHFSSPQLASTGWQAYDPLVSYDEQLKPQPELAESWDLSSDSKQIKLNLRKGVQFHNGREFTSDDVKYNLQRLVDPKNVATTGKLAPQAKWWTAVETPDKYTVIMKSEQPRPGVFDFLVYFNMVDKDTMEGPDARSKAIGTGPFAFVEYVQGDHLTLVKNKNYWRTGQPYLDGIQVSILRDQQSMVAQLEAGALDLADAPPLQDAVRLRQDPKYQVILNYNRGQFNYVCANTTFKPLDNKQVRQALNYAIDRKRFAETVLMGLNSGPQDLPWTSFSPAYDQAKNGVYSFDLDKARSLLAAAGVSGLEMDLSFVPNNEASLFAQIYQADLARMGVNVTLKPTEQAPYTEQVVKLSFRGLIYGLGSQAHLLEAATGIAGTRSFNFDNNSAGFKSPDYTRLFDTAATEPDASKRKQLYAQLSDFILDQSFTMPLALSATLGVATSNVHGLAWDMQPRYLMRDAWLG